MRQHRTLRPPRRAGCVKDRRKVRPMPGLWHKLQVSLGHICPKTARPLGIQRFQRGLAGNRAQRFGLSRIADE